VSQAKRPTYLRGREGEIGREGREREKRREKSVNAKKLLFTYFLFLYFILEITDTPRLAQHYIEGAFLQVDKERDLKEEALS